MDAGDVLPRSEKGGRSGDAVHISEMCRLVRGTGHILDVLDVLHRDHELAAFGLTPAPPLV
ncbi:hypothetical protein [Streptomyces sp. NPDC097981]|uniref:hypothetical protein n=1 Tax=Streptomyces sp. NPDC097981 TaxID=3155428 RepID=UPI003329F745